MRSQFEAGVELKRIDEMRQRKKIASMSSDIHQQMMAVFEDKIDAFAQGFESSQSSELSEVAAEPHRDQSPFPEIERMKARVEFNQEANLVRTQGTETNEEASSRKLRSLTMSFLKEDKMKEAMKERFISKTLAEEL